MRYRVALLLALFPLAALAANTDYLCPNGGYPQLDDTKHLVCATTTVPTPVPTYAYAAPTPVPTATPGTAPTPQPTYAYTAPTAIPTYAYTAPTAVPTATPGTAPTPQPTYAYTAPTPVPTIAPLSATYDPASLAALTSRCDAVTVTGIVTGKTVIANPGVDVAVGCVIAGVRASAANTVTICWRNAFATSTACDTASSTWLFKQP